MHAAERWGNIVMASNWYLVGNMRMRWGEFDMVFVFSSNPFVFAFDIALGPLGVSSWD